MAEMRPRCRQAIAWLDQLRLMHIDAHRLYVHAGVDPDIPLDRQSETTLLWHRYPKGYSGGYGERHVVHGHDNNPDGPLLLEGRTNLDTLAWRTGRLTVGVFDDPSGRSGRFHRDQGDAGRPLRAREGGYWGFRFAMLGVWPAAGPLTAGPDHCRQQL